MKTKVSIIIFIIFIIIPGFSERKYICKSNVNLRRDASSRYIAYGRLKYGTAVEIKSIKDKWVEIEVSKSKIENFDDYTDKNKVTGWVKQNFLSDNLPVRTVSDTLRNRITGAFNKLKSNDWRVRYKGLEFIKRNIPRIVFTDIEEKVIQKVIPFLGDSLFYNRRISREILSSFGTKVLPYLHKALNSKNWHVRYNVFVSIGKIESELATELALKALLDIHPKVRLIASGIIKKTNSVSDTDLIFINDNFAFLIDKLKMSSEALDNFFKGLTNIKYDISDRKKIFESLIMDTKPEIRISAVKLIGNLGDKSYINFLRLSLMDENSNVREEAGIALEKIK